MRKFEEAFVRVSKNIILFLTILSLFMIVGLSIYIVKSTTDSPDKVTVSDSGSLTIFRNLLEKEHSRKYDSPTTKVKSDPLNTPQRKITLEIMDRIFVNLNSYCSIVGAKPVDRVRLEIELDKRLINVVKGEFTNESVLLKLEKQTKELDDIADQMKLIPLNDTRRIDPRTFVNWFFDDMDRVQSEAKMQTALAERALVSKRGTAKTLTVALPFIGAAFLAFLSFLILIRMDLGIRLISEYIRGEEKDGKDNKAAEKKHPVLETAKDEVKE